MQSCNFFNSVCPISFLTFDEIPASSVIALTMGKQLRFYDVRALHCWMHTRPIDPATTLKFSKAQRSKIRKCHAKSVKAGLAKFAFEKSKKLSGEKTTSLADIKPLRSLTNPMMINSISRDSIAHAVKSYQDRRITSIFEDSKHDAAFREILQDLTSVDGLLDGLIGQVADVANNQVCVNTMLNRVLFFEHSL
jgi:hypothetical protein